MAQLACELCGSTQFVKDNGFFVCQGCGTKYPLEEARAMVSGTAARKPLIGESESGPGGSFDPAKASVSMGNRDINNYICQGFQKIIADYRKLPHPTENALHPVAEQAKACLVALNNAAMIDPDDHVADILIYENCAEIVDAMTSAKVHEKREDGTYRTTRPLSSKDLRIPGEKDSWKDKASYHRQFLIEEYKAAHPLDAEQVADLEQEKAQIEAELAVLKEEKKSKGFFNFSEKGKVKERMRPYEAKLSELNSKIYAIRHGADLYIEDCLKSLAASFTRLQF